MIIDGKQLQEKCLEQLIKKIDYSSTSKPNLAIISVNPNPATLIFMERKRELCQKLGFLCSIYIEKAAMRSLIDLIHKLNQDSDTHGIILQLPLPNNLEIETLLDCISPEKDIDGLTTISQARLLRNSSKFYLLPCTAMACLKIIQEFDPLISGKKIAIIGRSQIVGRPLSLLLSHHNATVTLCHSHTQDLINTCLNADIIIAAMGNPKYLDKRYFHQKHLVIDVGINRQEDGQICGDVDFLQVQSIVSGITPVPGGVGPMTVYYVVENLYRAFLNQTK